MLQRVPEQRRSSPPVFSRDGVRALDRHAIDRLGIPGVILMEHAAAAIEASLLRRAREWWPGAAAFGVLIFSGPGNNGGDGYALARRLRALDVPVSVVGVGTGRGLTPDAAVNRAAAERLGVPIRELVPGEPRGSVDAALSDLQSPEAVMFVDALLGTGVTRPLAAPFDAAVQEINARRAGNGRVRVLSVDLPSGLDCDSGLPWGEAAVIADATVTLAGMKAGLLKPCAGRYSGSTEVGPIGLPEEVLRAFALAG